MNRATLQLIALLLLGSLSGCAQWKDANDTVSALATPKPSPSASVIDIGFVPLPIRDDQIDWRLWNDVDEQILSDDLRKQLAANGLRAGRIAGRMPKLVADELEVAPQQDSLQFLEQANLLSEVAHGGRRVFCRNAMRYELPVRSQMRGEVSVLIKKGESLTGRRLIDPLFQFSMETRRGDNGEIILRLVPEIKSGDMKQAWISNEQALRLESRRDVQALEHLAIEIPLEVGHAVLISPTATPRGIGEKMLMGQRVDELQEVVAVVLRLSQSPSITPQGN
ncbi:hypothetical protein CA51_34970 [Rosistilla oblonga]|uniref:Uncharacterized protein n=1 Tax=Rosistilla oblonga TaxID=2527990 RepID=A0A518IYN7_9BACT|nr:hypothetical protein [Rosistilla oblonga]QDV13606.1 hypothetical protein CA51_34970 [Rosistilla oblonga]QDV58202.1 hypothetical protein Mal33_42190 [Rosistilla oblonga]